MQYPPVAVFTPDQAKEAFQYISPNTAVYCLNPYSNTFRRCLSLMEAFEFYKNDTYSDLVKKYNSIATNPRLGTVYQIDERIQDIEGYELILTMKLKTK